MNKFILMAPILVVVCSATCIAQSVCPRPSTWGPIIGCSQRTADVIILPMSASTSEITVHQRNQEDEPAAGTPGGDIALSVRQYF